MPINFAAQIGRSQRASQLIWYGLAESTRKGSQQVRSSFTTFVLTQFGRHQCFPAKEEWLVEFVAKLDSQKKSYHVIQRDIYALKSWHTDVGMDAKGFGTQLERILRGVKRLRGIPAPQATLPIQLPLLRKMLMQLPLVHQGVNLQMYQAAFTLAFACFLRSGEIVHGPFMPQFHLSVGSVVFAGNYSYAIITLPASKSDPFRQGVKMVAPATGGIECPVLALRAITQHRSASLPLFHNTATQTFNRSQFIKTVHKCLSLCNVSPNGFSGHSFRRGAATWASRVGFTEEEIKVLGRWNSDCVRRYIDRTAEQRCTLASRLFQDNPKAAEADVSESWRHF